MFLNVFVLKKFLWFFEFVNFFDVILVNILHVLSKYRSTFRPHRKQTNFVADCLTKGFLAFGGSSFHTKFSDFFEYFPIFSVVFVSFVSCNKI